MVKIDNRLLDNSNILNRIKTILICVYAFPYEMKLYPKNYDGSLKSSEKAFRIFRNLIYMLLNTFKRL